MTKHKLTGERVHKRLEAAMRRQEELDRLLSETLRMLPDVLSETRADDLIPQLKKLETIKEQVDEAIVQNLNAQTKIGTTEGYLRETKDFVATHKPIYDMRSVATIIQNERQFFMYDVNTVLAVLEIVEPAIFAEALKKLDETRWNLLIGNTQ